MNDQKRQQRAERQRKNEKGEVRERPGILPNLLPDLLKHCCTLLQYSTHTHILSSELIRDLLASQTFNVQ